MLGVSVICRFVPVLYEVLVLWTVILYSACSCCCQFILHMWCLWKFLLERYQIWILYVKFLISYKQDQLCLWSLSHFLQISTQGSNFSLPTSHSLPQITHLTLYPFVYFFVFCFSSGVVFFFLIAVSFSASEIGTNQRWAPSKSSNSLGFSSKLQFLRKSTQNSSGVGPDDAVIIVDHGSRRKESNLMLSKNNLLKSYIQLGMFWFWFL